MQILSVADVIEIYVLWHGGHSKSEVARQVGVDRKTVRKYVRVAERAGLGPGGRPMTPADWAPFVGRWFPLVADARERQPTWREIAAHHVLIIELVPDVPVARIHERLRTEHGLRASLPSLRRYIRANVGSRPGRTALDG